ncbi:hypothetical protein PE067_16320 [Paracoccus sp. DMF-8]|uniref:hypothetical protein n=1 Tax=Paracoccus sp. DMF-8 TaxID=3019445 RepID=UPI0023E39E14|nr:hypothetical protein [Paracoccus sp. DMF-8]MDF3607574.1 hypothetical protein [Paracoccus sp. DMF-8]
MTADTTTAPERIWADMDNLTWVEECPDERMKDDEVAYIRADLCRAPVAQDAEPVAWMSRGGNFVYEPLRGFTPLYAHPAPQPSDEAATLRYDAQDLRAKGGHGPKWVEMVQRLWDVNDTLRDRAEAAEAALAAAEAHADVLAEAVRPFARHVDKATCAITVIWTDGDYRSTYSGTLKPADFYDASLALAAHQARRAADAPATEGEE